jgi:ABC-type dipeptide/oligopeptide/nickel transport system permease component
MVALTLRRLLVLPLQVLGVTAVVFVLLRLIPGNPAFLAAGAQATQSQVDQITRDLGLDKPLLTQFWSYLGDLVRGDLGTSLYTGNAVTTDLTERAGATLELITLALVGIIVSTVLLCAVTALSPRGIGRRIAAVYGFVAGSVPDFWLGLALIYVVYFLLATGPSPAGQLSEGFDVPTITGAALPDSLLAGDLAAFGDAISHVLLPVLTLILVYSGPVARITGAALQRSLEGESIAYTAAWGIRPWRRVAYAMREITPTFIIALGGTYGYLLGGAVLVERVFGWGGLGQYAVDAVTRSDYWAIQGFVLVAGIVTVLVYLITDLLQAALEPRLRKS